MSNNNTNRTSIYETGSILGVNSSADQSIGILEWFIIGSLVIAFILFICIIIILVYRYLFVNVNRSERSTSSSRHRSVGTGGTGRISVTSKRSEGKHKINKSDPRKQVIKLGPRPIIKSEMFESSTTITTNTNLPKSLSTKSLSTTTPINSVSKTGRSEVSNMFGPSSTLGKIRGLSKAVLSGFKNFHSIKQKTPKIVGLMSPLFVKTDQQSKRKSPKSRDEMKEPVIISVQESYPQVAKKKDLKQSSSTISLTQSKEPMVKSLEMRRSKQLKKVKKLKRDKLNNQ